MIGRGGERGPGTSMLIMMMIMTRPGIEPWQKLYPRGDIFYNVFLKSIIFITNYSNHNYVNIGLG